MPRRCSWRTVTLAPTFLLVGSSWNVSSLVRRRRGSPNSSACPRATVHKWVRRYREEGWTGLADRCSRPHTSPCRTSPRVEASILEPRATTHRGALFVAGELGLVASTVGRVLARHQVPHLSDIDPITGAPVRRRHSGIRYERPTPGICSTSMSRRCPTSATPPALGSCTGP